MHCILEVLRTNQCDMAALNEIVLIRAVGTHLVHQQPSVSVQSLLAFETALVHCISWHKLSNAMFSGKVQALRLACY